MKSRPTFSFISDEGRRGDREGYRDIGAGSGNISPDVSWPTFGG